MCLRILKAVLGLRESLANKFSVVGLWMLNFVIEALRMVQIECNLGHWSKKCFGVSGFVGHRG